MSKVHDAFGIHRPGAASAPRYLLLCALLLTIPAFYIELDVAAVPFRGCGRWLYALASVLLVIDFWHRRINGRQGRMDIESSVDLLILAGTAASAFSGGSPWSDIEWLLRLVYCAIVFLRIGMLMGHYVRPNRVIHMVVLALILLGIAGGGFLLLEPTVTTYPEGLWLAFLTAATLGYGELMPSTPASRIFAVFIVLLGYALFSLVTASIAAMLIGEDEKHLRRELHSEAKLLRAEIAALRKELPGLLVEAERAQEKDQKKEGEN